MAGARRRAAGPARCLRTRPCRARRAIGRPSAGTDLPSSRPRRCARSRRTAPPRRRLAAFDRPAFRRAISGSRRRGWRLLGAEMAQHEPAARGGAQRRIVVDDDAVVAADPSASIARAESAGRGQHVRRRIRLVGQLPRCRGSARPGYARRETRPARRGRCRHVPRRNRPDEVRLAQMVGPASQSRRAESMAPRIGLSARAARWPRDGNQASRQAQRAARFAG